MWKKLRLFSIILLLVISISIISRAANPTPLPLEDPRYDRTEPNTCSACHFTMGANGDHNMEAVGLKIDSANTAFSLTGSGWLAARHSQSNHGSTQNTFCSKCHSPLQATPQASFNNGFFQNTDLIADGKSEGVVCATCHPSHTAAAALGRRLGIYKFGTDRNLASSYTVVKEGEEDTLCLNCHVQRHNETNVAFQRMYNAGVRCIDCHMAVYGTVVNTTVPKRFHDWKVAQNLPYSCGVSGAQPGYQCHPEFSVNSTLAFLPYLKEQHKDWWPLGPGSKRASRLLQTPEDYLALWREIQKTTDNQ
ncbi:MAG: multiheme c-type cytochrome [Acidobacteriia bacterium]|nr:multiheme c-type cytochrome [Terriglobia bacterium]